MKLTMKPCRPFLLPLAIFLALMKFLFRLLRLQPVTILYRDEQLHETLDSESHADNERTTNGGFALYSPPLTFQPDSRQGSSFLCIDMLQNGRWIEQVLPFSLLLLAVFIHQYLQGLIVAIGLTVVFLKSNDILQRQAAPKGDRKIIHLILISIAGIVCAIDLYYWHRHDDLLFLLLMLPPKTIPPFQNVIFMVVLNDALVREATMTLKCLLLMCYKNSEGQVNDAITLQSFSSYCIELQFYPFNFFPEASDYWYVVSKGRMLMLVEYMSLFYCALIPTPVWFRFFLNKENGILFASMAAGVYLTLKITSVVERVRSLFAAIKALSQMEIHYKSYATIEQGTAAGNLCAICHEKMHSPIMLRCKHIFCEGCVSKWLEREGTCPLCRAVVKAAGLRSFEDGSNSLWFQF